MQSGRGRPGGGLTKTQQLRQAKTTAFVQEYEQKQEKLKQPEEFHRRRRYARPEPKKVDFSKPTMTKAMMARMKQAEKFKEDYERKQAEMTRQVKRTPAPIGGDARMGRERIPKKPAASTSFGPLTRAPSMGFQASVSRKPRPSDASSFVPEKTCELARSIDADVVQAEPIGDGPIDSIIIPPGTVSDDRTTVISIPPPAEMLATSPIANRSIQVISETLDEQDAAESAAVQNRLADLQQARREFVIAVANVGGNAVNVGDETGDVARPAAPRSPPRRPPRPPSRHAPSPPKPRTPPRTIIKIPDVEEHAGFKVRYGLDHPDVVAAREFAQRSMAALREREAAQRMEREFEQLARLPPVDELQADVPIEELLYQDEDISWEEDEAGMAMPCPSRIKATMPRVPRRQEAYQYEQFDPEQLERFFDVQRYPPGPPEPRQPPPERKHLHPDLWELDDPWYIPPPEPDVPDLIDFDSI